MEVIQGNKVLGSGSNIDVNYNLYNKENDYPYLDVDSASPEASATLRSVALHLEESLRSAKKAHLSCGEVLLPPDLLARVARDILHMAETEPCGLRGCLILLNFQSSQEDSSSPPATTKPAIISTSPRSLLHSSNSSLDSTGSGGSGQSSSSSSEAHIGKGRNIGRVRWDAGTVTTFELHLTLREDLAPWYNRLPTILRNLTKGGAIVVSPAYTIAKKKLYRSHFY